jgi:hypothetical protein
MHTSRLSPSAREWIYHYSDEEYEQMRNSVPSAAIQELLDQGLPEKEAIFLASCRALMGPEVTADDPIYTDQSFSFSYQMPSGRMQPLEFELPPIPSPDSGEAPSESTP